MALTIDYLQMRVEGGLAKRAVPIAIGTGKADHLHKFNKT